MRSLRRKTNVRRISNIPDGVVILKWFLISHTLFILIQTSSGTLFAEDLAAKIFYDPPNYYPKIGSKVKSIKLHDTRTLNRASAKFADPLHPEVPLNPRYNSAPVYHPKVSDPLHVEVPLNPNYSSPPVYHPKV